ncbi:MAG: transposase [Bacillota bacterium]|jgi:REP element-mobilizing transposase RayT
MPRRPRIYSKTGIYHVIVRGNEKRKIFLDDEDRNKYFYYLIETKKVQEYTLYGYCLMDNHIHLLLYTKNNDISGLMKRINTRYAVYFNKKYDRVGHLFQDRYKSEAVEDERYLLAVLRYIHDNPVKAGLSEHPSNYNWNSYNAYILEKSRFRELLSIEPILNIFSKDLNKAIDLFIEFSSQDNMENTFDSEENKAQRALANKQNAEEFIMRFLKLHNVSCHNQDSNKLRELIIILKNRYLLSNRQIAGLLNVDRNFVQRTK